MQAGDGWTGSSRSRAEFRGCEWVLQGWDWAGAGRSWPSWFKWALDTTDSIDRLKRMLDPRVPVESESSEADTRARLREAAAEVFAEQGFRAATVREICARAGANVAAVHYHFGDKERLYREVLEGALRAAIEAFPPDHGLPQDPTSRDRLHAFVRSFLLRILTTEKSSRLMRLMAREMTEPTGALDHLVESVQKPLFRLLHGIVGEIAGADAAPEVVLACSQAVVAQCLFYKHAEHVITRMGHRLPRTETEIEPLARQITEFTLGGIERRAHPYDGDVVR